VDVYFVGILCVMGFIGNALSIAVLYRDHDKKNTTNWLLQTLAVVDTLYLFTCFFIQTLSTIQDYTEWIPTMREVFSHMMPYIWAVASIAQTITVWTVMLVTIDRYIAVCMPLQTHLRSLQRAKLAVVVVCLLAILYNIPRFFERKVVVQEQGCIAKTIQLVKTDFRRNKVYFLVYKTIMYFMFRTIGPLLTLIILNVKLILALKEMRRKHKDLTKGGRHRENITLMLVIVVSVFVICEIPDLILRILITMHEFQAVDMDINKLRYVNVITNMLLTVNSSINFLIYCLVGKKFRKILLDMHTCGHRMGDPQMEISETEPLTTRTNIITKNGTNGKDADVCL
jgi:neuropeptide Y receptor type 1